MPTARQRNEGDRPITLVLRMPRQARNVVSPRSHRHRCTLAGQRIYRHSLDFTVLFFDQLAQFAGVIDPIDIQDAVGVIDLVLENPGDEPF